MKLCIKYQRPRPSFRQEDFLSFSDISVCKHVRPIFEPRAIICSILAEVHKVKLRTKYQRPGPSGFRKFFPIWVYAK